MIICVPKKVWFISGLIYSGYMLMTSDGQPSGDVQLLVYYLQFVTLRRVRIKVIRDRWDQPNRELNCNKNISSSPIGTEYNGKLLEIVYWNFNREAEILPVNLMICHRFRVLSQPEFELGWDELRFYGSYIKRVTVFDVISPSVFRARLFLWHEYYQIMSNVILCCS